ncbi:MAG: YihY/virulence factor BrkB family protein [Chloroflexi bacterium]|nr:YihY/virulence factor BrkB family protein [Chloroflexota bacterium]
MRIDCSGQRNLAALKQLGAISQATLRRFSDEEGMHLAAGIAFYALMSLFPVALLFVSIFSFVFSPEQVAEYLVKFLGNESPVSPTFLLEAAKGAEAVRGPVAALGSAGLVLSSSLVFASIMRGINRAWGLIGTGTRKFMKRKLWELALMAGAALVFFAALVATNILDSLREGPFPGTDFRLDPDSLFLRFLLAIIPIIVMSLALLLLYKYVPTTKVRRRDVWFPALLGAIALHASSLVMTWYVSTLGYYDAMYGSLTTVILLLLWIYVCANILIGGAALSAVLSDFHNKAEAAEAAAPEAHAPDSATVEPAIPASVMPEPTNPTPPASKPETPDDRESD